MVSRIVALAVLGSAVACRSSAPPGGPRSDFAPRPLLIELRLARSVPADGFVRTTLPSTGEVVYLSPDIEIDNQHIATAEAIAHPAGLYINLWLTEAGRRRLAAVMTTHVGEHMALLINKQVVAPPPVIAGRPEGVEETLSAAIPLTVSLALAADSAGQLAAAVAHTWPTGPR